MQTGSEARASFDNRGFNGVSVVADIDSQGSYIGDTVVEASSSERYPVYTGEHLSPSGVIWGIYVNDGAFYASPLAIGENAVNKNVIVTEADVVTQYDAMKNEFSDFTVQECLNDGVAVLKVDRIDLATLDAYTAEQIGAL
ncbi:MAG TPA: hypothetical protein DCP91_02600 [Eggerthellaceae bacterium]|nr:hypothetical protein [Eggerthellaceae bacterium]